MAGRIDNDAASRMSDAAIEERLNTILDAADPTMDELYEAKVLIEQQTTRRAATAAGPSGSA